MVNHLHMGNFTMLNYHGSGLISRDPCTIPDSLGRKREPWKITIKMLVLWNHGISWLSIWECHHPNWLSLIFFRGIGHLNRGKRLNYAKIPEGHMDAPPTFSDGLSRSVRVAGSGRVHGGHDAMEETRQEGHRDTSGIGCWLRSLL